MVEGSANAMESLSELEKNIICETSNMSMGAAITTLSMLLGKKVGVAIPEITIATHNMLKLNYQLPFLMARIKYAQGFVGETMLVLKKRDAAVIVDLMMGGNGIDPSEEFNQMHFSALSEAMNQMMGSAAKALSFMFNRRVIISTPELFQTNLAAEDLNPSIEFGNTHLVLIIVKMFIEGLIDSEIMQVMPLRFAKEIACSLKSKLNCE